MPETNVQTPATFTIKVLTRHSTECEKHDDPTYENAVVESNYTFTKTGKVRYVSAKTRSWAKAEEFMRAQIDARDPVKRALREIEEREAAKAAERQSRQVTVDDCFRHWLAGLPRRSRSRAVQFNSMASKLKSWAAEQGIANLADIKPRLLYAWRGSWSETAENERDRLAPATQNLYVSHLHRFFKWAVQAEYLDRDPSVLVKRQKYERIQTQPLTTPEQFSRDYCSDVQAGRDRYTLRDVPEYGQ